MYLLFTNPRLASLCNFNALARYIEIFDGEFEIWAGIKIKIIQNEKKD